MGLLKALAIIGLAWLVIGGIIAAAVICVAGLSVRRTWIATNKMRGRSK